MVDIEVDPIRREIRVVDASAENSLASTMSVAKRYTDLGVETHTRALTVITRIEEAAAPYFPLSLSDIRLEMDRKGINQWMLSWKEVFIRGLRWVAKHGGKALIESLPLVWFVLSLIHI